MRARTASSALVVAFLALFELVLAVPNDNTLVRRPSTCMHIISYFAAISLIFV